MNEVYKKWRYELTDHQAKIDAFDEAFYSTICDDLTITKDEIMKAEEEHKIGRQALVEQLEAHIAAIPEH